MRGLTDVVQWAAVEDSQAGDHERLINLLRSNDALTGGVREYIASQLELEPKKRFSRVNRRDRKRADRDFSLFYHMARAKLEIAAAQILPSIDRQDDNWLAPYYLGEIESPELEQIRWFDVSNRAALDWLSGRGYDYEDDELNNAMTRQRKAKPDWDQFLKQRSLLKFYS